MNSRPINVTGAANDTRPGLARIVVLVSGGGSNLQALIDACDAGTVPGRIVSVVSNRAEVFALERAQRSGIPAITLTLRDVKQKGGTRHDFDRRLADVVAAESPDLIVLAGFMHVLSPAFLDRFSPGSVVNLHPSLLPDDAMRDEVTLPDGRVCHVFRGHDAVAQALAAGVPYTGTSVHFVTADVDRGPLLGQTVIEIQPADTVDALQARIQAAEHRLLPTVVADLLRARGFGG